MDKPVPRPGPNDEVRIFRSGGRVPIGAITPGWGDPAAQAGYSSQSGQRLGGWKFAKTKDGVRQVFSCE
jgi:hypothetical protein